MNNMYEVRKVVNRLFDVVMRPIPEHSFEVVGVGDKCCGLMVCLVVVALALRLGLLFRTIASSEQTGRRISRLTKRVAR
jgi:hypothetical protein